MLATIERTIADSVDFSYVIGFLTTVNVCSKCQAAEGQTAEKEKFSPIFCQKSDKKSQKNIHFLKLLSINYL